VDLTSSLGLGAVGISSHEERDHLGGINWSTTVCSAKSSCLACADFVGSDDGGIGLSSTGGSSAVTGSSVSDWMELEGLL
jgi:hypothetical protein